MKGDKSGQSPARRVTASGSQTQTEQRQQVKFRLPDSDRAETDRAETTVDIEFMKGDKAD